jgi:uncharacterized membrane protein YdjX (TVP38/TMEM64 family)
VVLGLILLGLVALGRRAPVVAWTQAAADGIAALGPWGPVVFGLGYVVAVVLMLPAAPLTLAAGALFGPVVGTLTCSLAATTGAALAFLIARHAVRGLVEDWLRRRPMFSAVDRAISAQGWRIVALLRLSPAVPFNVQNYLYGLTGIRFWPCVLTSWVAMLPGTFLYIYLGHVGRAGIETATGERSRTAGEWALIALGLAATVALTVSLTRMARQALRQAECESLGKPAQDRGVLPAPVPNETTPE